MANILIGVLALGLAYIGWRLMASTAENSALRVEVASLRRQLKRSRPA